MPLIQTRGSSSISGYGGASVQASTPTYIEDVFSTYLYTGNGSTQTITNGINLSGKGGLVWTKSRTETNNPDGFQWIRDTSRGITNRIAVNSTDGQIIGSDISSTTSSGFNLGYTNADCNRLGNSVVSWTFRKQPKFFDIVTYTGNGNTQNIAHNLGSAPGCIIVKRTDSSTNGDWAVWHRSLTYGYYIIINSTAAQTNFNNASNFGNGFAPMDPTSTVFTVGNGGYTNSGGGTYVAYLFAHNAGGFGLSGLDNVISCGATTADGSGNFSVNLGYEPQWVLMKSTGAGIWSIIDNMRGMPASSGYTSSQRLQPQSSAAEDQLSSPYGIGINATGFAGNLATFSNDFIYIAIRRGPMKVPTSGTSVYATSTSDTINNPEYISNFPVDMEISTNVTYGGNRNTSSRLLQGTFLFTNSTNAESAGSQYDFRYMNGWATNAAHDSAYRSWMFRRAPGFFDVVCYTGTGTSGPSLTHNLAVIPELIFYKKRTGGIESWIVYLQSLGTTQTMYLNTTDAKIPIGAWTNTPTASQFTAAANDIGCTYVAYLFASCAGVSKVGSYTGTGTTQQINCGFSSGSRFVLIKRTDSTGDWYVWDTARGIVSGNDPYLLLNTTAAEVTNTDYIDPVASGFELSSTAPAAINANGGTYIFLAIA